MHMLPMEGWGRLCRMLWGEEGGLSVELLHPFFLWKENTQREREMSTQGSMKTMNKQGAETYLPIA